MPVNRGCFHGIILYIIQTASAVDPNNGQQDQTCEYMEGVHACHHKKCCTGRAAACSQAFLNGKSPFHQDHTQQKAQSEKKGHRGVVEKALAIPVMDQGLAAVHEEGGDQQDGSHTQPQQLVQLRSCQPKEVHPHDHQTAKNKCVGNEEEPQPEAVGASFIVIRFLINLRFKIELVNMHVIIENQRCLHQRNNNQQGH